MSKQETSINADAEEQAAFDAAMLSVQPVDGAAKPKPAAPSEPGTALKVASDLAQGARDTFSSVWRGVTGAINEATDNVRAVVGDTLEKHTGHIQIGGKMPDGSASLFNSADGFISWHKGARKAEQQTIDSSVIPDPSTSNTGRLIEGAAQFGVGMIAAGKMFKVAGVTSKTLGAAGKVALSAAKGAVADVTVFDAYQDRISNMVQEHPWLENPVTAFMAAKPDDSFAEAKLKQALEGSLIGLPLDALTEGLKVLKASRLFSDPTVPRAKAEEIVINQITASDAILNSVEKNARFTIQEAEGSGVIKILDTKTGQVLPDEFRSRANASSEAGARNMLDVEAVRAQAVGKLTPEQIKALTDEHERILASNDPEDIKNLLHGTDFNFLHMNSSIDASAWIESISKVEREAMDTARGGATVSHAKNVELVKEMFPDGDSDAILSNLSNTYHNTKDLAAHLLAGRKAMFIVAKKVSDVSRLSDGDPANAVQMFRLTHALDSFFTVTAQVKSVVTNTARAVESNNINVADLMTGTEKNASNGIENVMSTLEKEIASTGAQSVAARKVLASLEGMTPHDMQVLARRLVAADGDPTAILAMVKAAPREHKDPTIFGNKAAGKVLAGFTEYWINALLSGPMTFARNTISNFGQAFILPLEMMNAGRPTFLALAKNRRSYNPALMQEGADKLIGNFLDLKDSWSLAAKALKTGDSILDPGSVSKSEGSVHYLGGYVGDLVRSPSRLLMASDEGFKQMAYRSQVRAAALREARGLGWDAAKTAQHVINQMEAAFLPDGKGINKVGLDYARTATFTTPLQAGSVASKVQAFTNEHPVAKLIQPFTQTPANIMEWTWQRTPVLRKANKMIQEDLAAGGERAAMAQAKLGTGMAIWGTAAALAASGQITGKGPDNPALRQQWKDAGNIPYSINIGGVPISYKGLDPVMMPYGIVADLFHASGEMPSEEYKDVAAGVAAALAGMLSSRSYLVGSTNFADALTSNSETKVKNYLQSLAGTLVPSVLNQTNPDEGLREVRGYVDAMLARLPGFSNTLPPRVNIFGEPVMKAPGAIDTMFNAFTPSGTGDGVVESKLLELGSPVPMPKKEIQGVSLTSRQYGMKGNLTPYDRMLQLVAQPPGSMPSLRESLTTLVNTPAWDNLPQGSTIKQDMVNERIAKYRMVAEAQVLVEFPDLQIAIEQALVTKGFKAVKGDAGIAEVLELFKNRNKD